MTKDSLFRRAHSRATDARQAAREFHAAVGQPDTALVVFFCSSSYDLAALADELNRLFGDIPLYGCTTAGEIGPGGYCGNSLSGVGFSAAACAAVGERFTLLQDFRFADGQDFARNLVQRLETVAPQASAANTFAFLMIDGLSVREEPVVYSFQSVLGTIPLCGGSAGDDRQFARTWIFHEGAFHADSALLILVSTPLPFRVFKTQHFISDKERLVVTEADAANRVVRELNGLPAAFEYARVLGVSVDQLTPEIYSETPIVVVIDGTDYVRSVQKVNADGSLTFFCAIEEGLVLRVAHAGDILHNLQEAFARVREEIGPLQLCIGCDCILRNLEIARKQLTGQTAEVFESNNTIGFATYGEQFGGVHVNQTFTGIAIGTPLTPNDG